MRVDGVNIHPSLLPAFKGKDAIGQAIAYGVKVMGVTIHYVDETMDGGQIIAQRAFDVLPQWSHEEIEQQVHAIEHELFVVVDGVDSAFHDNEVHVGMQYHDTSESVLFCIDVDLVSVLA